jgi:hypothetical protein
VLVAAGAGVIALLFWPSSQGVHRPAALAGLPGGWIAAVTPSGGLALSAPAIGRVKMPRGLGNVGDMVAVSPGNRYLALFNGQVIIVRPGPALAPYPAKVPLSSETTAAWPAPFADHGRALVMLKDSGTLTSSNSPISVVSTANGRQVPLGSGDHVAGDPQAAGAFVAVPAPATASAAGAQASPDSRIELRDAGRPPVLLATAGSLDRALGQPAGTAVSLAAYPDPSGTKVAVTVRPASGGTAAGVVVLARAGRVLSSVRASLETQSIPVWSPSGRSLAYLTTGTGAGAELKLQTPGGPVVTSTLPHATSPYTTCVWSPDARALLCAPASGAPWAITRARDGHAVAVRGAGYPLAWLS